MGFPLTQINMLLVTSSPRKLYAAFGDLADYEAKSSLLHLLLSSRKLKFLHVLHIRLLRWGVRGQKGAEVRKQQGKWVQPQNYGEKYSLIHIQTQRHTECRIQVLGRMWSCSSAFWQRIFITDASHEVLEACDPGAGLLGLEVMRSGTPCGCHGRW